MTSRISPPPGWIAARGAVPRLLHIFSTFAVGGPQRRFAAIANHFGPAYRHLIWPMDGRTDAQYLLTSGGGWDIVAEKFPKHSLLRNAHIARQHLRALSPDVLVTYNWGAIEWAAGNVPRLVRHIHVEDGFGPEEAERQLARRVWMRRLILNRHSTVVLPSQTLVKLATERWRLNPARLVYLPNGIACARFGNPVDQAPIPKLSGTGLVIGTVATLRAEKALDRLIEAFAVVRAGRDCRLVIVGGGPERERLEGMAAAQGLAPHVTFTGPLDRPEQILSAFDVFALSSDTEQMPLSVLEAMAAGLPVASTDVGDVRQMLAEDNRALVVNKSSSALAEALAMLLDDPTLRRRLGAANRAKAWAIFDEAKMFAGYGRLFDSIGKG